ncbi:MAG: hypothetical protein QNL04_12560 [SAR324 cluster bacterium]|nr:hypothetical protein [SAR324 cluster bacterium]
MAAASPQIPKLLVEQLKLGGIMLLPLGQDQQQLLRITKAAGGFSRRILFSVRFVLMMGESQKKISLNRRGKIAKKDFKKAEILGESPTNLRG